MNVNGPAPATTAPLTAYLHLPWCVRKCPYCDFNSHVAHGELPFNDYADALIRDMDFELEQLARRSLHAVFFGGGTPSLFPAAVTERVLNALAARLSAQPDIEITLEANPGAADCGNFRMLRAAGVNRLSIGVQSFNDAMLRAIGRIHTAADACRALEAAGAAGFANVNLDLMYGLPGQDVAGVLADVEQAIGWEVPHISAYQLTLEPRTWFYRHPPLLPDGDVIWEMQQLIEQRLTAAGYARYEVSAWARPGHQCRHNLNYWRFGDYLGLGAGAHGKIFAQGVTRRRVRRRHPLRYMESAGSARALDHDSIVATRQLPLEFLINALRLCEGFAPALFTARTGLSLDCIEGPLEQAVAAGLLARNGERIAATERGLRFLNDLLELFLPAAGEERSPPPAPVLPAPAVALF